MPQQESASSLTDERRFVVQEDIGANMFLSTVGEWDITDLIKTTNLLPSALYTVADDGRCFMNYGVEPGLVYETMLFGKARKGMVFGMEVESRDDFGQLRAKNRSDAMKNHRELRAYALRRRFWYLLALIATMAGIIIALS